MNGEERDRLIKLETRMEERWDNHDKRSEEIWKEIRGNIKGIFGKLDNLYCHTHKEKINNLEKSTSRLYVWFVTVIVGGIVLTLWIKGLL